MHLICTLHQKSKKQFFLSLGIIVLIIIRIIMAVALFPKIVKDDFENNQRH